MINTVNETFGTGFQVERIDRIKDLPVYMTFGRSFYKAYDGDICFFIVEVDDEKRFGVVSLDKQRHLYEEKTSLPVVYYFAHINKTQRDSLINHRIPFIADEKQLYIPFLGIAIHNLFKSKRVIKTDKMMPITQSLFLYLLYECQGKKVMKKDAANFLDVTRTSITRSSEQLLAMGLIKQESSGKESYMYMVDSGYDLFNKAKEYLINPIQEAYVTEYNDILKDMPISGEPALSKYSMINPSKISCVAVDKSILKKHSFEPLDEKWDISRNMIEIEFWKYNPVLFAKNGVVDPISLYMTKLGSQDERIEGALEEMLERYKW